MNAINQHNSTHWATIWVIFLAGCTLALHVGKFPVALPLLIEEFNLSLSQSGKLVSIYAVLIALGGLLCGMFVSRVGYVTFALTGVSLCVVGSFGGAYASTVPVLMLTRAIEGLGWIMGVVAIPILMSTLSLPKDRPVVMGLWGAFMGIGGAAMLLVAPHLQAQGGWRLSWMIAAVLSGMGVLAMAIVCHQRRDVLSQLSKNQLGLGMNDLRQRKALAVFVCFLCYSFQYVSVMSFLPALLVQDSSMLLASASHWTALVLVLNAIGNMTAGWFINRGIKRSNILTLTSLLTGLCSLVTLAVPNVEIRLVAALLMACIGGIIPGTLFSTATLVASSAAASGVVIGFMLTGTGIGQLFGPVLVTRVVEWNGHWYSGGLLCLGAGVIGAVFARWLSGLPVVSRRV